MKMCEYAGVDGNGIPRVWAQANTAGDAIDECKAAIEEYCRTRPDIDPKECTIKRIVYK